MTKKIFALLVVVTLSFTAIGCAKIGKATGTAVKEVKEMPGEFKEGYKEGRESQEDAL